MKLDQIESMIQSSATKEILFKELSHDLIKELKSIDLLPELVKSRIELLIEKETCKSIEENAKQWFGLNVEKTYFERRDRLERVSFKLVRNENKGIMLEAYQRLNENEEEWSEVSNRWGIEPERKFQGKYRQILVHKLNEDLINALRRNEVGDISQPLRMGKYFAIVQLDEWMSIELNNEMRGKIQLDLYKDWLDRQVVISCEYLDKDETETINTNPPVE